MKYSDWDSKAELVDQIIIDPFSFHGAMICLSPDGWLCEKVCTFQLIL